MKPKYTLADIEGIEIYESNNPTESTQARFSLKEQTAKEVSLLIIPHLNKR